MAIGDRTRPEVPRGVSETEIELIELTARFASRLHRPARTPDPITSAKTSHLRNPPDTLTILPSCSEPAFSSRMTFSLP